MHSGPSLKYKRCDVNVQSLCLTCGLSDPIPQPQPRDPGDSDNVAWTQRIQTLHIFVGYHHISNAID